MIPERAQAQCKWCGWKGPIHIGDDAAKKARGDLNQHAFDPVHYEDVKEVM